MAKDDKLKALDAAIAQIERQYGKGSVMKLGDNSANMNVETVPTGSLSLDTFNLADCNLMRGYFLLATDYAEYGLTFLDQYSHYKYQCHQ